MDSPIKSATSSPNVSPPKGRHQSPKKPDESWKVRLQVMSAGLEAMQRESKAILDRSGMTAEEMDTTLSNPSNFSPEVWQLIEESRQKAEKFKREFSQAVSGTAKASPESPKSPRTPKPKAKKNWIPIQ